MSSSSSSKVHPLSLSINGLDLVEEVSRIVQEIAGIQLGKKQYAMVQARLGKRMLELGFSSAEDYLKHIHNNKEVEVTALVSLLTTHHTFFFREFSHFEYLERFGLPKLVDSLRKKGQKKIRVWSAACSRGQEVYSLSMFLSFHLKNIAPEMSYEILGTDVDPESVLIGKNGVYGWNEIKEIPSIYLNNHWVRGTGEISEFVKAKDPLKSPCRFETINLFDLSKMKDQKFEIIFCRNVFIYFKPEQIKSISSELLKHLTSDGIYFIGMSESLNGLGLPISYLGPSIYMHEQPKEASKPKEPLPLGKVSSLTPVKLSTPKTVDLKDAPIRVLCVDDSVTVLSLLKKVLSKEAGFEVIATAKNGLEAKEILKKTKVDVVTLDIHMPEQDGVEYLEKNYTSGHPPVVMISSVSREDSALGLKALGLGAKDYIEKPTLSNLQDKSDEIRTKLRCAIKLAQTSLNGPSTLELERSFKQAHSLDFNDQHIRIIVFGVGDREKVKNLLKHNKGKRPVTILLSHGPESLSQHLMDEFKKLTLSSEMTLLNQSKAHHHLLKDHYYFADFKEHFEFIKQSYSSKKISLLLFSSAGKDVLAKLEGWSKPQVILEDLGSASILDSFKEIRARCKHFVPYTSFIYHSDDDLTKDIK